MKKDDSGKDFKLSSLAFPALIVAIILIPTASTIYVKSKGPSPEDSCLTQCAAIGKAGRMTYTHRPEMTTGMRSPGPMKCECY